MVHYLPPGMTEAGTSPEDARFQAMEPMRKIWLVNNVSSGSNDDDAIEKLLLCLETHGLEVVQRTAFPDDELPSPEQLDAAGAGIAAVFAGDGTINSFISGLDGWGGAVLVLPGGTMNLLYHRLHGEQPLEQVVAAVAEGKAVACRPGMIRSVAGNVYAGLLAGPGASWGRVREAMRDTAVAELAVGTIDAINKSLVGEMIACIDPPLGRPEGYPLVMLTPEDEGIKVDAYYAEAATDYLDQAWALLRRNFREGPHDLLGHSAAVRLASTQGNPFGLLVDGENAEATGEIEFRLAAAPVDLLATGHDGR